MNEFHCEQLGFNPAENPLRSCKTHLSFLLSDQETQGIYTLTPLLISYELLLGVLSICHVF